MKSLPAAKKRIPVLAAVVAMMLGGPVVAQSPEWDLMLTNARIVDGTGNPWFYGDVAVKDGDIVAVGDLDPARATKVIDVKSRVLAPGFIDVHTHADGALHNNPAAENFIRNGVTTIVTGNCGGSVADVGTFFERLQEDGVALNVATLYGHNTILRVTKGDRMGELTEEQWHEARGLLHKAMRDGAIGMSTGLIYTPGRYSDTEEIIELQSIAQSYGGIYVSHIRDESADIVPAIEEALRIGRETNSRVQISHFKMPRDVVEDVGGARATLAIVERARAEGMEVWLDQYPYTASSTTLATLVPAWTREDGSERMREILEDPDQRERLLDDMRESHEVRRKRDSMDFAVLASASGEEFRAYQGFSVLRIAQIRKLKELHGEDVNWMAVPKHELPEVTMREQYETVIDILLAGRAGGVYHTMPEEEVETIMRSPLVSIASDSGIRQFGVGSPHPRGYGTNARVLGRYVRDRGVLTLEEAVRKMTSLPALQFRIADRGIIRPGYRADLVVFDPDTIGDTATFEQPHAYPEGYEFVFVNGVMVYRGLDDSMTEALPGEIVWGPGVTGSSLASSRRGEFGVGVVAVSE